MYIYIYIICIQYILYIYIYIYIYKFTSGCHSQTYIYICIYNILHYTFSKNKNTSFVIYVKFPIWLIEP